MKLFQDPFQLFDLFSPCFIYCAHRHRVRCCRTNECDDWTWGRLFQWKSWLVQRYLAVVMKQYSIHFEQSESSPAINSDSFEATTRWIEAFLDAHYSRTWPPPLLITPWGIRMQTSRRLSFIKCVAPSDIKIVVTPKAAHQSMVSLLEDSAVVSART